METQKNNQSSIASASDIPSTVDALSSHIPNNILAPMDGSDKVNEVKFDIKSNFSSSSDDDDDDDDDEDPMIPDGGWGWVIVFASFTLAMIVDGVSFSFGLLYVEFLKEFEASNSATSWIGSLYMSVPLLTGPIMSALVDKYGCRTMTMVGGVISATGFVISSKCHSLSLMYLTFGVVAGLGLGLIYVTMVVSVAFWFDKRRTLAVGIAASGIGFGTFIFSPITTFLISEYNWRGATLLLAGCFLNICVGGALMRDPDWIVEQNKKKTKSKLDKSTNSSKLSLAISAADQFNAIDIDELKAVLTSSKNIETFLKDMEFSLEDNEDKNKLQTYFQSAVNLPTFLRQHENVPIEVLDLLTTNKNIHEAVLKSYPSIFLSRNLNKKESSKPKRRDAEYGSLKIKNVRSPSLKQSSWSEDLNKSVHEPLMGRQYSKKSQHEKYFKNLKLNTHSLVHRGTINTNKYRFRASSCPNIYKVSMVSRPKVSQEKWYSETLDLIKEMFDYSLFLELHFFLFSLSTVTLFIWFIVPYFFLAELMISNGYPLENASFTISNIGISNTIGMLFLGWIGDRPWMNITKTCAFFILLSGLSIGGLMFFLNNYILLQVCASIFGISLAGHFTLTPGIIVELVPLDRFTLAYGLQLLCQGIGQLVGPPFAGLLFDVTGSWEQSFYQASVWTILSGILVAIIPYTKNRKIIGQGVVEKETEQSDKIVPLIVLIFSLVVLIGVLIYMITISLF